MLENKPTRPLVIFVDGFNTVGKDYAINAIVDSLMGVHRKRVALSDPRVWFPKFQASKRYWDFINRPVEEIEQLTSAHYHQLRSIEDKVKSGRVDVIVSNRSFMSALHYNLNEDHLGGNSKLRERLSESYWGVFESALKPIADLIMINIDRFHNLDEKCSLEESVQEMRARVHKRDPNILMNDFYLKHLIESYKTPPSDKIINLFDRWYSVDSDVLTITRIVDRWVLGMQINPSVEDQSWQ